MKHKVIRIPVIFVILIVMAYTLFRLIPQVSAAFNMDTKLFYEPKPIAEAICYMDNNGTFYICDKDSKNLQMFSGTGDFIKGLSLPAGGGAILIGQQADIDELYIYCVRKKCVIVINNKDYAIADNVSYINPTDFYEKNNIDNGNLCRLKGNRIYFNVDDIEDSVELSVKRNLFTVDVCIIILVLSYFTILALTGLLRKLIDASVKNIEIKKNQSHDLRRRK